MNSKILFELKGQTGIIRIDDKGILSHTPYKGVKRTSIQILQDDFKIFTELAKDKKVLFLYDATSLNDFTSEQKKFMQDHLPLFARKQAVLIGNGFSQFAFNMFLHLYKPKIPIRGFTSKKRAIEWLLKLN